MAFVGEIMERAEALEIERQRREVERQESATVRLDRLLAVMERLAGTPLPRCKYSVVSPQNSGGVNTIVA